ncbi:TRAP transporter small permease [Cloacibacillus porcorum]|uniref:TRAP transporter small permease n=1 Tax=Cloacibacillus porcorum TaxID=1197717 RepID=UPI0014593056|nr:TRAP transporter small permease [Cloacibacillus porcorum]MCC8183427.1 TRAP transporter small permease [Cloacibacillus porcorum]MDY5390766.1 TRAP transporter small permease [Cloacibacillus porcorum]NMF19119.1 TRAP transporter small permease [Cloacibacillus porcorum]
MDFLRKIDEKLMKIEECIVAVLLFIMTIAIFVAVVERFVIQLGLTWVEEFARYLSVWAAFVGAGLAVKKGAHIGIEAFVQILPKRAQKIDTLAVDIVGILFSVIVTWIGVGFIFKLSTAGTVSPALGVPITWAYAAVPFGCALMAAHYLIKFLVGLSDLISGRGETETEAV